MTGHTDTDAPFCAELFIGDACGSTTVPALFTLPNTKTLPSLREVMFRGVILSFSVMLSAFTVFHYLMLNNVIKAYSDSDGAIVGINVFNDDSAYMLKP